MSNSSKLNSIGIAMMLLYAPMLVGVSEFTVAYNRDLNGFLFSRDPTGLEWVLEMRGFYTDTLLHLLVHWIVFACMDQNVKAMAKFVAGGQLLLMLRLSSFNWWTFIQRDGEECLVQQDVSWQAAFMGGFGILNLVGAYYCNSQKQHQSFYLQQETGSSSAIITNLVLYSPMIFAAMELWVIAIAPNDEPIPFTRPLTEIE